jgi:archaellum component FlaF (FlaF/FlaG flagellin family)
MKIKILILIVIIVCFSMFFIGAVNAMSISQHDTQRVIYHQGPLHSNIDSKDIHCYKQNSKKCKYYGYSQMMVKITGKSSELSNLRKINVKINGKTIKNYKNNYKVKKTSISFNALTKGNALSKRYTITAYDKYNKVIKTKKGTITTVWKFAVSKTPMK